MKRILHQVNLDRVGGVESLFANYVGLSDSVKFSHQVLVSNSRIHPNFLRSIFSHIKAIKYSKYAGPLKLPKIMRPWWVRLLMRRMQPNVIVYWNTARHTEDTVMNKNIPYIYYDHGLSWLHPDCEKFAAFLTGATKIIACGHSSRRMMQLRWGIDDNRIEVVPNGFREDAKLENLKPKTFEHDRPLRLGLAGRLIPLKGASIALHMLKALVDMGVDSELYIAGEGVEKQALSQLALALNLQHKVWFLGVIKNMHDFYQKMDFFVSPTLRDPFPLVAIEALSHGCVPIMTAVDGCPDIIDHGLTGFCINPTLPLSTYPELGGRLVGIPQYIYNPALDALSEPMLPDPQHMAEVIKGLAGSPGIYQEMSRQGIAAGKTRFTFSNYVVALDGALEV